ncbi:MPN527 family putative ECF transporter permease subunit [Mycoplasma sp. Z1473D]
MSEKNQSELINKNRTYFVWNNHLKATYNIAFSGIMLALAILLSIISSFMKFTSFLSFNISLIPAFIAFTYLGLNYGLLVALTRFLLFPLLSVAISLNAGLGLEYFGNFIGFVSQLFTLGLFYLLYRVISRFSRWSFLINISLTFVFSALAVSIIMPMLNTFLFNLVYFKMLGLSSFSLSEITSRYDTSFKAFFLGIPNYYAGSMLLYFIFNLSNILINYIIIYIFIAWEYKTNFINKISSKNIY